MKRSLASGLALALAVLAVAIFAKTPAAQTGPRVLEACGPEKEEIDARALPGVVAPERCPVAGREIADGPVASEVPTPGEGVYSEALTIGGTQELVVRRLRDGSIELGRVGDDAEDAGAAGPAAAGRAPGECRDGASKGNDWRVDTGLGYRINLGTVPRDLSRFRAAGAIRAAGSNVANTNNGCRLGDRVPAGVRFEGKSAVQANIGPSGCTGNDRISVVSFGDRPSGVLATTCIYFDLKPGYDTVTSSDVEVNKFDYRWTTKPRARSCKRRYDLEAVMTHERGHTFGLGHVPEKSHRHLTMSTVVNGPCQTSERSLGRGDVLGLDAKYP